MTVRWVSGVVQAETLHPAGLGHLGFVMRLGGPEYDRFNCPRKTLYVFIESAHPEYLN